jgi:hypothetical protein
LYQLVINDSDISIDIILFVATTLKHV